MPEHPSQHFGESGLAARALALEELGLQQVEDVDVGVPQRQGALQEEVVAGRRVPPGNGEHRVRRLRELLPEARAQLGVVRVDVHQLRLVVRRDGRFRLC